MISSQSWRWRLWNWWRIRYVRALIVDRTNANSRVGVNVWKFIMPHTLWFWPVFIFLITCSNDCFSLYNCQFIIERRLTKAQTDTIRIYKCQFQIIVCVRLIISAQFRSFPIIFSSWTINISLIRLKSLLIWSEDSSISNIVSIIYWLTQTNDWKIFYKYLNNWNEFPWKKS